MIEIVPQQILEKAKSNLIKHFVLWGNTFEIRTFFCILKHLGGSKARRLDQDKITKPRKSRPRKESAEERIRNDRIILQRNLLDQELYTWAMIPWHDIKVKYAEVCS